MGFILFMVAFVLFWYLIPVFLIGAVVILHKGKKLNGYFYNVALSLDQTGNTMGAPIFNSLLLKGFPSKFYGNPDETISHVTGVNLLSGNLTKYGLLLVKILDTIDKGHCEKAAKNEQ